MRRRGGPTRDRRPAVAESVAQQRPRVEGDAIVLLRAHRASALRRAAPRGQLRARFEATTGDAARLAVRQAARARRRTRHVPRRHAARARAVDRVDCRARTRPPRASLRAGARRHGDLRGPAALAQRRSPAPRSDGLGCGVRRALRREVHPIRRRRRRRRRRPRRRLPHPRAAIDGRLLRRRPVARDGRQGRGANDRAAQPQAQRRPVIAGRHVGPRSRRPARLRVVLRGDLQVPDRRAYRPHLLPHPRRRRQAHQSRPVHPLQTLRGVSPTG
mmetsp:Transcript_1449/g.5620  ORF Transcript_1449/g.5620 Transcript_1449/m.5620 type:complete len:273 (+) Transcript_1449:405-1223(+)